jgi:ABC-type Fe3+/spermidine/putrescine transport system ATPase subunit
MRDSLVLGPDVTAWQAAGPKLAGSLRLESISKRYGEVVAVADVNLEIQPGEFVTLLGPSGSGKTTTLLMVAGFVPPTKGEIYLAGKPMRGLPAHQRNVGMVFQNYALFPHMNVFDNIAFPLRRRKLPQDQIVRLVGQALELVRLSGLEQRFPRELSGGQQQRVAVARATVYRPPLLLMDEPLSALDKKLRQEMQTELRRIHNDLGTSLVYVTHDQEEALALSDRIVLMRDGQIEQIGSPQAVYERPRSRFAATFLGEINLLDGHVQATAGTHATVSLSNGARVVGTSPLDVSNGAPVTVAVRPENLELLGPGNQDGLEVTVSEAVYLGQSVRLAGKFATGEPCVMRLGPALAAPLLATRSARVRWSADQATVLLR